MIQCLLLRKQDSLSSICLAKYTVPVQRHHPDLMIKSSLVATGGYIDASHEDFDATAQNCGIYKQNLQPSMSLENILKYET